MSTTRSSGSRAGSASGSKTHPYLGSDIMARIMHYVRDADDVVDAMPASKAVASAGRQVLTKFAFNVDTPEFREYFCKDGPLNVAKLYQWFSQYPSVLTLAIMAAHQDSIGLVMQILRCAPQKQIKVLSLATPFGWNMEVLAGFTRLETLNIIARIDPDLYPQYSQHAVMHAYGLEHLPASLTTLVLDGASVTLMGTSQRPVPSPRCRLVDVTVTAHAVDAHIIAALIDPASIVSLAVGAQQIVGLDAPQDDPLAKLLRRLQHPKLRKLAWCAPYAGLAGLQACCPNLMSLKISPHMYMGLVNGQGRFAAGLRLPALRTLEFSVPRKQADLLLGNSVNVERDCPHLERLLLSVASGP